MFLTETAPARAVQQQCTPPRQELDRGHIAGPETKTEQTGDNPRRFGVPARNVSVIRLPNPTQFGAPRYAARRSNDFTNPVRSKNSADR